MPTKHILAVSQPGYTSTLDACEGLKSKYHVEKFTDPENAVEYAKKNPVHLLITDSYLKGMQGEDMIAIVQGFHQNVSAIFVPPIGLEEGMSTLKEMIDKRIGPLQSSGSKVVYLLKPLKSDVLEAKVAELIG